MTLATNNSTQGAFTVDVEDYFQVSAFENVVRRDDWDAFEVRVVANTHRVLRLLEEQETHATFFVLGWVAARFPQLVRDILRDGHEIGSHSFWHRCVFDLTPEEFRDDLLMSRDVLEDITGDAVKLYRAPSFSITNDTLWALDILAEEGFEVDSSVFPVHHDRYGIPDAPRWLHRITDGLWEFPPTTSNLFGLNIPAAGGGYFRLLPYRWTEMCLQSVAKTQTHPLMFYIHPWELDPEQPRMPTASRSAKFRHYTNLHSTETKLQRLLTSFEFGRITDVDQIAARLSTPTDTPQSSAVALATVG